MSHIQPSGIDRRSFLSAVGLSAAGAAAAATALTPAWARAQGFPVGPETGRYPSGVWKVLDERFRKYMVGNTPLVREWTGALWAEGPAWNGVGRYVVFSDIPNNVQMRWDEATGEGDAAPQPVEFFQRQHVRLPGPAALVRAPDRAGRSLRVSGRADGARATFDGKRLNAPNDVIVHPKSGGILFSDPDTAATGTTKAPSASSNCRPASTTSIRQNGRLTKLTDEIKKPNGLCFSPDYRTLYVADTAPTHFPNEKAKILAMDGEDNGRRLTNRREFAVQDAGFHDGIRADVDGNVWCGTGFGGEGVDGVHVYAPDGARSARS